MAVPVNYQPPTENFEFGSFTGLDDIQEPQSVTDLPSCPLCEFVMVKLEEELKNKKTEEEIKDTVKKKKKKNMPRNAKDFEEKL